MEKKIPEDTFTAEEIPAKFTVPDSVLEQAKTEKPEFYPEMIKFNELLEGYYNRYPVKTVNDAFIKSAPEAVSTMTVEERLQLMEKYL